MNSRALLLHLFVATGLLSGLPSVTLAQMHATPERPREGQTVTFELTIGNDLVEGGNCSASHSPGTLVSRQVAVADADPAPGVQWTPDAPGLWEVSCGESRTTLVVARRKLPISGLFVLVMAAASLIFLSVWGLGRKS